MERRQRLEELLSQALMPHPVMTLNPFVLDISHCWRKISFETARYSRMNVKHYSRAPTPRSRQVVFSEKRGVFQKSVLSGERIMKKEEARRFLIAISFFNGLSALQVLLK